MKVSKVQWGEVRPGMILECSLYSETATGMSQHGGPCPKKKSLSPEVGLARCLVPQSRMSHLNRREKGASPRVLDGGWDDVPASDLLILGAGELVDGRTPRRVE